MYSDPSSISFSLPICKIAQMCVFARVTQSLPVVAAGSEDKTIRLINVETGKLLGVLSGHQDTVESVAFYDNKGFGDDSSVLLASGGLDGVIHLWDCR